MTGLRITIDRLLTLFRFGAQAMRCSLVSGFLLSGHFFSRAVSKANREIASQQKLMALFDIWTYYTI